MSPVMSHLCVPGACKELGVPAPALVLKGVVSPHKRLPGACKRELMCSDGFVRASGQEGTQLGQQESLGALETRGWRSSGVLEKSL